MAFHLSMFKKKKQKDKSSEENREINNNVINLEFYRLPVAHCAVCGAVIDKDGELDAFFPYYSTYNRCKNCLHVEKINPYHFSDD